LKEYDIIVIGSGAGLDILDTAVEHGHKAALVDKGPIGGTCLNVGCIPSKMLIFPADRIMDIQDSARLGIDTGIKGIDFAAIMERMHRLVDGDASRIKRYLKESKDVDFYEDTAEFVEKYTLKVGGKTIRGKQIYLASGSRPLIPPIPGLDEVDYLTNESLLQLKKVPKSLIVIGGGYVGVEYAHFFSAMGAEVTIIEMGSRLLPAEEPEISAFLQLALARRMTVHAQCTAESIEKSADGVVTVNIKQTAAGQQVQLKAEKLLLAAGRSSNADLLKVEKGDIATDKQGYIKVDAHMETNIKGIYAIGDANGREMFTHISHAEASVAAANGIHGARERMDYWAAPHAIFTHPQVASVGLTEEAAARKYKVVVGRADYADTALGAAMMQEEGFAKIIIEEGTSKILGGHIVGPWASVLIQEVVNAMARKGGMNDIARGIHIHPSLSELVVKAVYDAAGAT